MDGAGAACGVVGPARLEQSASGATFTDLGDGRTEIVLHSTVHTTDEMRGTAQAGLAASLERLAQHLTRK